MAMRPHKILKAVAALLALGACAPAIPDSGDSGLGVGVSGPDRDARAQARGGVRAEAAPEDDAQGGGTGGSVTTSELTRAGIGGVETPTAESQADPAANDGISDEQDFEAVAARETIESDAERRERQAAAYEIIEPTALPRRPGDGGPNIVQFALEVPNDKGEPVYSRAGLFSESRFQRNCAKYNNPDAAQRDFLARGGPARDRLGLDPDGDGFACGWDPTPFRTSAGDG